MSGRSLPIELLCFLRKDSSRKPALVFLFLLWLTANLGMLWFLGIRTGADSEVYTRGAYALLNGHWPEGRLLWYSTYIGLLALALGLGGTLHWVVGLQIILSGIAAYVLLAAVRKITVDFATGFVLIQAIAVALASKTGMAGFWCLYCRFFSYFLR